MSSELPSGWDDDLPSWDARRQGHGDPRGVRQGARRALAPTLPELWGGSADLAESNNTTMEGEPSFLPEDRQTKQWPGDPYGRTLHFGIREHAMGAIMNGIRLHGGTRPYGGTFLIFSDYMRPAVRLAALMRLPVHLRLDPRLHRARRGRSDPPADRAPRRAARDPRPRRGPAGGRQRDGGLLGGRSCEHNDRPAGAVLTRQALPIVPRGADGFADTSRVAQGRLRPRRTPRRTPDVILIGTGSEVQYAVEARELLAGEGIAARVVSMPCREWFDEQDDAYRDSVIPPNDQGPGQRRSRRRQGWRDDGRRRRPDRLASTTTVPAPPAPSCSRSSASPPTTSPRRPRRASRTRSPPLGPHSPGRRPDPKARSTSAERPSGTIS